MRAGTVRASRLAAALLAASLLFAGCGAGEDLDRAEDRVAELTARDDAEKAALDAARQLLLDVTTYSWKDGEHEFAWVDRLASQDLKEKLAPNVPGLKKAIVKGKVTAKGKVVDAMARAVDPSKVEVLAFVDQALTDEVNTDIKIEEQRVSMTMVLQDGTWRAERFDLLSGTNSQ